MAELFEVIFKSRFSAAFSEFLDEIAECGPWLSDHCGDVRDVTVDQKEADHLFVRLQPVDDLADIQGEVTALFFRSDRPSGAPQVVVHAEGFVEFNRGTVFVTDHPIQG